MMLQNKNDNDGFLRLPSQKYRDSPERTAVQVTEDDPCRSKSEYFSISPSTPHPSRWHNFGDIETDAIPKSPPTFLISDSPSSLYEDDLEHDGEVSSSVVSSPSVHISPSSSSSPLSSPSVLSPFSSMSKGFLSSLPSFPENSRQAAVLSIASYQESDAVPDNMLFADSSDGYSSSQGATTSDLRSARCCSSQYIEEQSRMDSVSNRPHLSYINQNNFDVEQSIQERDCSAKVCWVFWGVFSLEESCLFKRYQYANVLYFNWSALAFIFWNQIH